MVTDQSQTFFSSWKYLGSNMKTMTNRWFFSVWSWGGGRLSSTSRQKERGFSNDVDFSIGWLCFISSSRHSSNVFYHNFDWPSSMERCLQLLGGFYWVSQNKDLYIYIVHTYIYIYIYIRVYIYVYLFIYWWASQNRRCPRAQATIVVVGGS